VHQRRAQTAFPGQALISGDDLQQARRAELAFWPYSLDAPLPGQLDMNTLADLLGEEDPRIEHMLGMQAVAAHWGELSPREQEILQMDFRGGMTQVQIGRRLRISQMHVSRLRAHALGYLRSRLLDPEGTSAAKGHASRPALIACAEVGGRGVAPAPLFTAPTRAHPVRKAPGPVIC
jgi:DNA-binding CsgD family transcriptional regulator